MNVQLKQSQLINPEQVIQKISQKIASLDKMMTLKMVQIIEAKQSLIGKWAHLLDSLSPLRVVDRGYGIIRSNNKVIASIKSVMIGDELQVQLKDGYLNTEVKEITPNKKGEKK